MTEDNPEFGGSEAARESAARLKDAIELGQLHWSTGNYQPLQERALWAASRT